MPKDFPSFFLSTDKAAVQSQAKYLRCVAAELCGLFSVALLGAFHVDAPLFKLIISFLIPTFLLVSLVARVVNEIRGFDNDWFTYRALAEGSKCLTWKYMMRIDPFTDEMLDDEVDRLLIKRLSALSKIRFAHSKTPPISSPKGLEITEFMRTTRRQPLADRKALYDKGRIADEQKWYSNKSAWNLRKRTVFFWAALSIEVLAVLTGFGLMHLSETAINPVPLLAFVAAVCITWPQVKRFRELSQTYGLAAQELFFLLSVSGHVKNQTDLTKYVKAAEDIISKEHTIWLVKRDSDPIWPGDSTDLYEREV